MGPQPGPAADGECRADHRHPRRDTGARPRHQALWPVQRDRVAGARRSGFDRDANAGIDLFYNPSPTVRTNLTVNTDFAQVEVDQRQVNLTRFSLFFPERRDFFLDGATFLDFVSDTSRRTSAGAAAATR